MIPSFKNKAVSTRALAEDKGHLHLENWSLVKGRVWVTGGDSGAGRGYREQAAGATSVPEGWREDRSYQSPETCVLDKINSPFY